MGFLLDGVQYQADLPLQLVLSSHLVSLPLGFDSVQSELLRLHELGYHDLHRVLPFIPMHGTPQGATPRKNDPRFRRTSDGGAPRQPAYDAAGIQAISLNEAIGLKSYSPHEPDSTPELKWLAREKKPTVVMMAYDGHILKWAASIFHQPVFGFTDDVADYFNQIPVSPAEKWKNCALWAFGSQAETTGLLRSTELRSLAVVVEHRLGFGLTLSSNVGQRFADAILWYFEKEFDREEDARFARILDPVTNVCTAVDQVDERARRNGLTPACCWIRQRRLLSASTGTNQLRLYTAHMYTDDAAFAVVGIARLERLLQCWHRVTTAFGLRMAKPEKRQLGTQVAWLGFNLFWGPSVVTVQPAKLLRARSTLQSLADGEPIAFDRYRSLLGLLEHILPITGRTSIMMYGLYGNEFMRGQRTGPATTLIFGAAERSSFLAWHELLLAEAGCFFSQAVDMNIPLPRTVRSWTPLTPPPPEIVCLFSDAAAEGDFRSIGGYSQGEYWSFQLPQEVRLHITALELLGFCVNALVFAHRRRMGMGRLYLSDASSTVATFVAQRTYSASMQVIHRVFVTSPTFDSIIIDSWVDHVNGESNPLADAASRGQHDRLRDLAVQLDIEIKPIPLNEPALQFISQVMVNLATLNILPTADASALRHSSTFSRVHPSPQTLSRAHLLLARHLGPPFVNSEDTPMQFMFSAFTWQSSRPNAQHPAKCISQPLPPRPAPNQNFMCQFGHTAPAQQVTTSITAVWSPRARPPLTQAPPFNVFPLFTQTEPIQQKKTELSEHISQPRPRRPTLNQNFMCQFGRTTPAQQVTTLFAAVRLPATKSSAAIQCPLTVRPNKAHQSASPDTSRLPARQSARPDCKKTFAASGS